MRARMEMVLLEKHNLMLRLRKELYEKIKKESEYKGISIHELIVMCLNDKYDK